MVCIKCGQELEEGAKFCTKCGYGMNDTAPGKKLIKISGILFIVFAVFGIFGLIGNVATKSMMANEFNDLGLPTISGFTIFLSVLSVLLGLFLGITGIMYCNDFKKAKLLRYFAFGYIGFYLISAINSITYTIKTMNAMSSLMDGYGAAAFSPITILTAVIGIIIGFTIPVIYLLGAQKNLKANEEK